MRYIRQQYITNLVQIFTVKKLAEVQAFVELSDIVLDRSGKNFKETSPEISKTLDLIKIDLSELIKESDKQKRNLKLKRIV